MSVPSYTKAWVSPLGRVPEPTTWPDSFTRVGDSDVNGPFGSTVPVVDPVSGDMLFFGYSPVAPYLRYSEVNAAGELVNCTEIEIPAPVMMHDFVVTEHYAIFLDAPAVFDLRQMLDGHDPMSWQPDNGTRLGVIPRGGSGTDGRWFEIDNAQLLSFKETRLPVSEAPRPLVRVPVAFESSAPDEYLAPLAGADDALVILEGVSMYLSDGTLTTLATTLARYLPNATLAQRLHCLVLPATVKLKLWLAAITVGVPSVSVT